MGEKNLSNGFTENFEIIISGLSDDFKEQHELTKEIGGGVKNIYIKLENIAPAIKEMLSEHFKQLEQLLDKRLFILQNSTKSGDTTATEKALKTGIGELRSIVSAMEKPVSKKYSIRLFPEQNQERFYKIVYGGLFLVTVFLFFMQHTYSYLSRQQEINKQIELEAQKNNSVIKAWDYLYSQKNKTLHKLMDSAMIKTANTMK